MGSGFKTFTAGAVLTASDVNNYLMEQSIMSFATTTARDTALTAPEEGMIAVITGSDLVTIYTGSAWVEYGRYGAWESFTPTWTNLTVGNGTVVTKYVRIGSMVTYTGKITIGSTTSISGFVNVSLPVTAQDSFLTGSARYSDDGTRNYVGAVSIAATGIALGFTHSESGGFGSWNATNPFTIAADDIVSWNITYQAA
jgi:hypothetical protein